MLYDDADAEVVMPGASGDGPSTQGHYNCGGCAVGSDCDLWYDGYQYWCIPKTIYEGVDCGTACHDDDFNCGSSCNNYC